MSKRPGFNFCICPDPALTQQFVNKMLTTHHPEAGDSWSRAVFWADDGLGSEFWDTLTTQNLFGKSTVIILRNAQLLVADTWKKLNQAVARVNPTVWLFIFLEVEFERGQPKIPAHIKRLKSLEFANKQGWTWSESGLSGKNMQTYVRNELKRLGIEASPQVMEKLVQTLPHDATAIKLEIEKLALLVPPGNPELLPTHLQELNEEAGIDIFAVLRNLQKGTKPDQIWSMVLASHSSKERMLFPFIGALLREARTLWQLLFRENVYVPAGLLQEKQYMASQLGLRKLSNIWEFVLEAEQGVKSGAVTEEQALERLTANLFKLFGSRQ